MRMKMGDLSVGNARGWGVWGGRLLGRWRPVVTQTPANQFSIRILLFAYLPSNLLFYFSLTRLTYITTVITTVVDRSPLLSRAGNCRAEIVTDGALFTSPQRI